MLEICIESEEKASNIHHTELLLCLGALESSIRALAGLIDYVVI
jgi:hypothetical protein